MTAEHRSSLKPHPTVVMVGDGRYFFDGVPVKLKDNSLKALHIAIARWRLGLAVEVRSPGMPLPG
jgi:hypothetical protein